MVWLYVVLALAVVLGLALVYDRRRRPRVRGGSGSRELNHGELIALVKTTGSGGVGRVVPAGGLLGVGAATGPFLGLVTGLEPATSATTTQRSTS